MRRRRPAAKPSTRSDRTSDQVFAASLAEWNMGYRLIDSDEYAHPAGAQVNWNESRYIDFWDAHQRIGGWLRIGNRPNAGYAEMSACINLPDGRAAFMFNRPKIAANTLTSGDQSWEIISPWEATRVVYRGEVMILDDAWILTAPKLAYQSAPRAEAQIELVARARGLDSVIGHDQDQIGLIFLPGQADFHYQHLISTEGTIEIGDRSWRIAGRGGKDHSWGPRNWHAKRYLRWLIASVDDDHGFMLTRAVGPTKQTRSGFVWDHGEFHIVDDFDMENQYAGAPHYELLKTDVLIKSGERRWAATGTPRSWLPLRHVQSNENGEAATLRIVKSPTDWSIDGRDGAGMCEWHDLMAGAKPVGLHD